MTRGLEHCQSLGTGWGLCPSALIESGLAAGKVPSGTDPATGKPLTGIQGTGPLDPTINATYTFLTTLFKELQGLFPDKFVHVGGDEVDPGCWASNPAIQAWMKAHGLTSFADLETLFEQLNRDALHYQELYYSERKHIQHLDQQRRGGFQTVDALSA